MRLGRLYFNLLLVCVSLHVATSTAFKSRATQRNDLCVLDDFSTLLEDANADGIINSVAGPCTDREGERSYLTVGQGVFMPFDVIDNNFAGSFCIGFLVDTSLTNTAPLAYFHDIGSGILGNITVEGGAPGSVILNIKGTDIVFPVETIGFKRFQMCREGNEMTLYDDCSAVGPSQPFPEFDPDFQDTNSIELLRDLTSSQPIFQNGVTQFYFLSCTGPHVTQEGMAQVQCDSSPVSCTTPFLPLELAVEQYTALLLNNTRDIGGNEVEMDNSMKSGGYLWLLLTLSSMAILFWA